MSNTVIPNHILILKPAGGVAFNQLKDGSIRCHINPTNAESFRKNVLKLADEIKKYLVSHMESQKHVELSKHEMPATRIQVLEAELARLRAVPVATEPDEEIVQEVNNTIVRGGFEPDDGALPRPATI